MTRIIEEKQTLFFLRWPLHVGPKRFPLNFCPQLWQWSPLTRGHLCTHWTPHNTPLWQEWPLSRREVPRPYYVTPYFRVRGNKLFLTVIQTRVPFIAAIIAINNGIGTAFNHSTVWTMHCWWVRIRLFRPTHTVGTGLVYGYSLSGDLW